MKDCIRGLWTLLIVVLLIPAFGMADEEKPEQKKTFEGTWNNRKYNSSGPLRCEARPGEDGKVKATFSGTFMGDPFSYDVEFSAKPGNGQTDLIGKATVSGHIYDWTGSLKGTRLYGKYLGTNGYNGEFVLNEARSN
ncbi:hypothetical protein [Rubinisphaera italica]|uniref:Uncharacterized protein n=1 Tax=Rubinisphaera italica TaxID=2527969 RepID=A0A5C5XIF1_9PLAN|nr:hypothetical protein [Rubinisphaera italica]TWT61592.1 hypothetical protein Pan54_23280 [Rubinisphaera italica]